MGRVRSMFLDNNVDPDQQKMLIQDSGACLTWQNHDNCTEFHTQ